MYGELLVYYLLENICSALVWTDPITEEKFELALGESLYYFIFNKVSEISIYNNYSLIVPNLLEHLVQY